MSPAVSEREFSLVRLIPAVFAPTLVFEVGIGAILPVIAVTARDLGASIAMAGLLVAMLGIGLILGDVPAGALAARLGDRRAMLLAAVLTVGTLTVCALAPNLVVFALGVLATGAVNAVFLLARQTYLTDVTPPLRRASALSTLAGVQRIGTFIGPFAGALVIHLSSTAAAYWLAVGTSVASAVVVLAVPDVVGSRAPVRAGDQHTSLGQLLKDHRSVLTTLGLAILAVGAVRGARTTVLPLWTEHLGMSATTTSLVFGLSGAVDMLLFYPSGKVMDRRGRMWVAIPSMLVMALALGLLPLTSTVAAVCAAAMVLGVGNGIGSGILMTLGADVAPVHERSRFLGVWRLIADTGQAAGPLVISAGAALGSLAVGVWAMSATAVAASGALARWVPRWSVHASARTRRVAQEAATSLEPG